MKFVCNIYILNKEDLEHHELYAAQWAKNKLKIFINMVPGIDKYWSQPNMWQI